MFRQVTGRLGLSSKGICDGLKAPASHASAAQSAQREVSFALALTFIPGHGSAQSGTESAALGLPRMYGAGVRYTFGK